VNIKIYVFEICIHKYDPPDLIISGDKKGNNIMPTAKSTSRAKAVKKADAIMEQQCELAPFANNSHETEYTRMMHRYSELDKREKAVSRKQTVANLVLFVGVLLVISCLVGTWFVCSTIQSLQL
jgi:hypothetical protein